MTETRCIGCGAPNNQATDVAGEHTPREGDLTVCAHCGTVAVYNADLTTRAPTTEEQVMIDSMAEVQHYVRAIKANPMPLPPSVLN